MVFFLYVLSQNAAQGIDFSPSMIASILTTECYADCSGNSTTELIHHFNQTAMQPANYTRAAATKI